MGLAAAQLLREDSAASEADAEALALAMASPLETLRHRPLSELPGMSIPGVAPYWAEWLEHDRRDEHWEALRLSRDYADFRVPVMHVGGWFDLFTLGTVRNFQGMHAAGVAEQRLWMGPWSHTSYERYHGDVDFGGTAPVGLCGIDVAYLAFFDEHLRGQSPEEPQPTVRYFLMGANEWRDATAWPPAGGRASGRSTCAPAARRTARAATVASRTPRQRATSPPIATSTIRSGPSRPRAARCSSSRLGSPARASSRRSRRATTCSATRPRRSSSRSRSPDPVTVELWAVTDAPDTDWTAKLVAVDPDGTAISLCDGIRRASFRESLTDPSPVTPGEAYRYEIELGSTAYRFAPGQRLRLQVSSSNFPRFDANPNTGEPSWRAVETRPAVQQVLHDAAHPSALRLWLLDE